MDPLDALLADLPGGEEPEQEASTATPDAAAAKFAELDALVPDSADIDEEYRNKPVREVIRIATQHGHEIGVSRKKSQEFNALESRANLAEQAVAWWQQQGRAQNAPPQAPPEETDEALLDRLSARPTQVLPEKIREYVEPLERRLYEQDVRLLRMAADGAREQARTALGISSEEWEYATPQLAAITASRQWNIEDPNAWYAAGQELIRAGERLRPPPPAPRAPAVTVPAPAAPPSGGSRSTARPSTGALKLKPREQDNAIAIMAGFGITPDNPKFDEFTTFAATRKGND